MQTLIASRKPDATSPLPAPLPPAAALLLQCWLLSSWHQQAAFVLAVNTASFFLQMSERRPNLVRYVPEFYLTSILDMVGDGGRGGCVCVCRVGARLVVMGRGDGAEP